MQMNTRPNFYFEIRESTSNLTYKTFKLATPTYQKKNIRTLSPPPPKKKNHIFIYTILKGDVNSEINSR